MSPENHEADITNFMQAISLMLRRARAVTNSAHLSLTESAILARLAYDGPATTAALARGEGVKPQSMGTTIAELESRGLVRRKPHPTDGRQMNIELTAKGVAMRKSTLDAGRAWFVKALDKIGEDDRKSLFAAGNVIRQMLD